MVATDIGKVYTLLLTGDDLQWPLVQHFKCSSYKKIIAYNINKIFKNWK